MPVGVKGHDRSIIGGQSSGGTRASWGEGLHVPAKNIREFPQEANSLASASSVRAAKKGQEGGEGIPPFIRQLLQGLGGGEGGVSIVEIQRGPEGGDSSHSYGQANLKSVDIQPEPNTPLVQCRIDKKVWLEYLKAGKKIPAMLARMAPMASLPISPNHYLSEVQHQEVTPDIVMNVDGAGFVHAAVRFPWFQEGADSILQSPFSRVSSEQASERLKRGSEALMKNKPSGIEWRVNRESGVVELFLKGNQVPDIELETQLEYFFSRFTALIDMSRRLVQSEESKSLSITIENPKALVHPHSMQNDGDIDVQNLLLKQKPAERLTDIGGNASLIERLEEVINFHKHREHFRRYGVELPRGVLLEGPPGTGKTLAARVLAGELGVNFYNISSSDLLSPWFGQSEKNVRKLFDLVETPAILFFDEIDAIAQQRSGADNVSARVLGEVLRQMDGLGSRPDLLVLGATNRKEVLDPAMLRSGRFSHHVYVGLPDQKGREDILKIHLRNARAATEPGIQLFAPDLDIARLAQATNGSVGSDLREMVRRAVSKYAKDKLTGSTAPYITADDFLREAAVFRSERESKRQQTAGFGAIVEAREAKERMRA